MGWGSSLSPLEVAMELHLKNREKLLELLHQHHSHSSRPLHGFVLLQGGEEQTRHDTDHIELFRQESYFAYLFGVKEPGFYAAIVRSLHLQPLLIFRFYVFFLLK